MEKLYTVIEKKQKTKKHKKVGPDCGSDHELLIAKFRLTLKVGKTLGFPGGAGGERTCLPMQEM